MKSKSVKYSIFLFFIIAFSSCNNYKGNIVRTAEEFETSIKNAKAGDEIIMANGIWEDVELLIDAQGTKEAPILIKAEEKGKVIITGHSNLRISGEYIEVSGLVFKDGNTPTSEVIAFRKKKGVYANHCRLTECVIDNFNNPERSVSETWVAIYGKNNRVDHCTLTGKRGRGVTMTVRMVDEACRNNNHKIDHNNFGYRQTFGSNGGETLRLGTSHYSLSTCGTTVDANYFDRCAGEVEVISNKSCGNTFTNNTFYECRGSLTYRHGHDNKAERNFFFGNGVDNTGGIRVINERNTTVNNYFYELKGYRFRGALVIMNGVPNSPINRYNQVDGAIVANNTFVNCDNILLCAGSDEERSATPINSKIENNVFYHDSLDQIFTVYDDISGIDFNNNYLSKGLNLIENVSSNVVDMKLIKNEKGINFPVSSDINNAGCSLKKPVATKDNTGATWYELRPEELTFDDGEKIVVEPGLNTLFDALQDSKSGDILLLSDGHFENNKDLEIKHPVTIKAQNKGKSVLFSEKNDMFTIQNEGALKLQGLKFSGAMSPDRVGNSIISTSKYSMNKNYKLIIEDCEVEDLLVNHSYDFLRVFKNTFADSIVIRNCSFKNISGNIASLNKETDDIGVYNAEYVIYENNTFENIGGVVLNLYRGGTDESTFGPILTMKNCEIKNVGHDKRNKVNSSIYLHGVQVADITQSNIVQSAPLKMHLTLNGKPVTNISNLNIYPKAKIESNSSAFNLSNLTHKNDEKK